MKEFFFSLDKDGCRLDKFLAFQLTGISRSKLNFFITKGMVKVNEKLKKSSYLLRAGDQIKIKIPDQDQRLGSYNFPVPVIWEDESLLVIDKPQGLVVHPHGQNRQKTLVNVLVGMQKKLSSLDSQRPGVVHRLDKETSGVMVLAKNNSSHHNLVRQFKDRTIKKEYRVLVWGNPGDDFFRVNLPLRRSKKNRLKMEIKFSDSKTAMTEIKVLRRLDKMAYLAVFPETGRMHQIRVHLKFLNLPIIGDKKYGDKDNYKNLFLHAYRITLKHPVTGKSISFSSRLPSYFQAVLLSF